MAGSTHINHMFQNAFIRVSPMMILTCHSNMKVVEFSGSNLVIVGAGRTGKE